MDIAVDAPPAELHWPDSLRPLLERGQTRRYRKGALLIEEGDVGDTLFIVLSGRVKSFSTDARDREIVYGVYGAGEYLGEMSLDGGPRSASVITLEPTVCVVVTRKTLRDHIAASPEFAFELLGRVIRRARLATQSARSMALLDVYGRLTQLLRELAQAQPGGAWLIRPKPTHAELAQRIGCSREMVSRILKDLDEGGYVRAEARQMVVLKALPAHW